MTAPLYFSAKRQPLVFAEAEAQQSFDRLGSQLAQLYTTEELAELLRHNLRYARAFPPGPQRNQHRQIARSLRALFRNKAWVGAHTLQLAAPRRLPSAHVNQAHAKTDG